MNLVELGWTDLKLRKMTSTVVLLFLAFVSVSRSAPAELPQDLTGRWYVQASSGHFCAFGRVMPALQWSNAITDVSLINAEAETYNVTHRMKIFGFCDTVNHPAVITSNPSQLNIEEGLSVATLLPQTYCSDCVAVLTPTTMKSITLFSRRQTVTVPELRNFQIQASGLNMTSLFLWDPDFDMTKCKALDEDAHPELKEMKEKMPAFENIERICGLS